MEKAGLPRPSHGSAALLPARLATAAPALIPATAAARACELRLRPGLVDGEASSPELCLVQRRHGLLRLFVAAHLHECESTRTACRHVAHDAHRVDLSELREQILELRFPRVVREISNIQLATHRSLLRPGIETRPRDVGITGTSLSGPSTLAYSESEGSSIEARSALTRGSAEIGRFLDPPSIREIVSKRQQPYRAVQNVTE